MKLWRLFGALGLLLAAASGPALAADRNYEIELETGLGYDSNAFLAPGRSFFDPFSDAVIDPRRRSGVFVPVKTKGKYTIDLGRSKLVPSLLFKGRLYPDSTLNDADNYWINLDTDLEYLLRKKGVFRDRIIITPSLAYNREIYVDRETGLERVTTTTQESLADRFAYVRYGLEAKLRVRSTPVKYALKARVRKYDYETVPVLDSLDHFYYLLGAEGEYDIFRATTLTLGLDYTVRDFDNRRARDLDGDLIDGSDREYSYADFQVELERKIGSNWKLALEYHRLERTDEFVGYFDYSRNSYSGRVRYKDRGDRRLRAELTYWDRDYPRAFAFDQRSAEDPETGQVFIFPRSEYRTWQAELRGELPLPELKFRDASWSLWTEYEFIDQESADPRFDYRRHLVSGGIKVEL